MKLLKPTKTYLPLSEKAYDVVFDKNKKKILLLSIVTAIIVVVGFSLLFFLPQVVYAANSGKRAVFFSLSGLDGATYTAANLFAKPFYGFEKAGYYIFFRPTAAKLGLPLDTDVFVAIALGLETAKPSAIVLGLVSKSVMFLTVALIGYAIISAVRIFLKKNRFLSWYNTCNALLTWVSVLAVGVVFEWMFCCAYSGEANAGLDIPFGQDCLLNVLPVAIFIIVPTVFAAYLGTLKRSAEKFVRDAVLEAEDVPETDLESDLERNSCDNSNKR